MIPLVGRAPSPAGRPLGRLEVRLFFVFLLILTPLPAQVVISQIYGGGGNTGATLRNDFIELFNRGAATVEVTGWSVQYASASGTSWQRTVLAGSMAPGQYYLVQEGQGAAGTVSLPAPDASGDIAMSATSGKVTLVNHSDLLTGGAPSAGVVDFVGYGDASSSEGRPTRVLSNATAALRRSGGCIDTDDNSADFTIAAPNPRNTSSPGNDCSAAPPPTAVSIHQIQGAGAVSPFVGQVVVTTGVVTALKRNGVFIQNPEADADTDPNTSEGLFVFTSATPPPAAAKGNFVRVSGTVAEFRPASDPSSPTLTEITDPEVTLLSTGTPLPPPITVAVSDLSPSGGIEQLERFEGMRVRVASLTVIAPTGGSLNEPTANSTTNGVFYAVLTGASRPFREPGIPVTDPVPGGTPPNIPRFDTNPERLRIDSGGQAGATPLEVTTGATVLNLVGSLDYGSRTYTIVPDPETPPAVSNLATAASLPPPAAGEFTIASFNLQRFFDTTDDPTVSDPVLTPAAFANRLNKTSLAIRAVMNFPDIVGVQEVENLAALQALANKINQDAVAAGQPNPNYRAFLEEGNDIAGIDVGFLIKASSITVLGVTQEGKAATYTAPNGRQEQLNDRPPLVLRATLGPSALPLTVIVSHLRSLNDIEDPRVQAKRRAQAEFLAGLIQSRQSANPSENIIAIGDYNAFPFNDGYVDVMGAIQGTPAPPDQVVLPSNDLVNPDLINLIDALAPAERYSRTFNGDAETLDHIVVNPNLLARLSRFFYARANADFPESYRNNGNRAERASDHDMPVAYFALSPAPPQINSGGATNAASFLGGAVAPGELVAIFGSGMGPPAPLTARLTGDSQFVTTSLAGLRVLFDGTAAPLLYAHSRQVVAVAPYALASRSRTELRIDYRGTLSNAVTLPVASSAPGIFTWNATGQGQGAILNQNQGVNGASNPASKGEVVSLFATGQGQTNPPGQDGKIAGGELPRPTLLVTARVGGIDAEVLYAGAAPTLVAGVLQVNVRIPPNAPSGDAVPVVITVGNSSSQPGVTLAIR